VPEAERLAVAKDVADWVAEALTQGGRGASCSLSDGPGRSSCCGAGNSSDGKPESCGT